MKKKKEPEVLKLGDKMKVVHTEVIMTQEELWELLDKHVIELAPRCEVVPNVEVTLGPAAELWVNVDGVCRLRAKRCNVFLVDNRSCAIMAEGSTPDPHQDEIDDAANNHGQKSDKPEWVSIPYELAKSLEAEATMSPDDGEALAHYITEAEEKVKEE